MFLNKLVRKIYPETNKENIEPQTVTLYYDTFDKTFNGFNIVVEYSESFPEKIDISFIITTNNFWKQTSSSQTINNIDEVNGHRLLQILNIGGGNVKCVGIKNKWDNVLFTIK